MSDSTPQSAASATASSHSRHTALFTGMVLQHANVAMMCLGKAPRPDNSEFRVDLEAASLFIDTLEMLEARTRGNLTADEAGMLRETLTTLRITFVEAADAAAATTSASPVPKTPAPGYASTPPSKTEAEAEAGAEADARKKFVKRY